MKNDFFQYTSTLSPYILIFITAFLSLFSWLNFKDKKNYKATAYITIIALLIIYAFFSSWQNVNGNIFSGAIILNPLSNLFSRFFIFLIIFSIISSLEKNTFYSIKEGEYYFLLISSLFGAILLISTKDLLTAFLAIEILSMAFYGLSGILNTKSSTEASFKYFIMGSFASSFMILAIALIYGSLGTLNLESLKYTFTYSNPNNILILGVILFMSGLLFKIALVPFHMYTPDVYEGSPTQISALMASLIKVAGLFIFLKIFIYTPYPLIKEIIVIFSALTILTANLMALPQQNIKRLLAYSSVSHAGYIMLGFLSQDIWPVLFYLFVYSIATFGAFSVILFLEKENTGINIKDVKGLFKSYPILASSMAIFLFSLAGIPPLSGFFGKFYLFSTALSQGYFYLVIIAILGSAISLYYYLKIIVAMFMEKEEKEEIILKKDYNNMWNISIFATLTLLLGFFSDNIINLLQKYIEIF